MKVNCPFRRVHEVESSVGCISGVSRERPELMDGGVAGRTILTSDQSLVMAFESKGMPEGSMPFLARI